MEDLNTLNFNYLISKKFITYNHSKNYFLNYTVNNRFFF